MKGYCLPTWGLGLPNILLKITFINQYIYALIMLKNKQISYIYIVYEFILISAF